MIIKSDDNKAEKQLEEDYICPLLLPLLLQYIIVKLTRTVQKIGSWDCCRPKQGEEFPTLPIPQYKTIEACTHCIIKTVILKNTIINRND